MAEFRCPGQDLRFWKIDDIYDVPCDSCGELIEFWKDEPVRKCPKCGEPVRNSKLDLGCAKWCQYADKCVAATTGQEESVRDSLIKEMRAVFGDDRRRIKHALSVLAVAEEILEEEGGDPLVVKAAAVLHDIGIHASEAKHGSSAPRYQEIEGPPIARPILEKLSTGEEQAEHVCRIIGNHHSAREIDTLEFRIIWDADLIVNMGEEISSRGKCRIEKVIEKGFRTEAGRRLAKEKLSGTGDVETDV